MKLVSQNIHLPRRVQGVFYGWWLVAISGFVMVIATVPLFHAMSLWFVALENEFQWSRTQLSLAFAFTRVEGGIMGPIEGYLTDRLGARRMVLMGLLILGVGFLLFWQVRHLWMFYLAFVVMALGQGLGSLVPLMTALNNWFVRRRAAAMGWSSTGSRLGALLLVPVIAWAIDPAHNRLGWQNTALILGVFTLLVAFPLARLIRNRPEDYNQRPDGDAPESPGAEGTRAQPRDGARPVATGFTASQALRTPAFWFISIGHGFISMAIVAMMAHLGPLMKDEGFSLQTTGWVVTTYTAVAMLFQIIGGYVGDQIPKNVAIFGFAVIQAAGVMVITLSHSISMAFLFAVLFGIGFGGRNPLTTAIRGDYFGRGSFGKILGLSTVPINVLLLVAAPFLGILRDLQGNYTVGFMAMAVFSFLGGVLFLMARKPELRPSSRRSEVTGRAA